MTAPTPQNQIAQRQAALVAALTQSAPPPAGFDASRLDLTARTLISKRAATIARLFPTLTQSLAENFTPLFATFAQKTPYPAEGNSLQDGLHFAQHLLHENQFPPTAARELLQTRARLRPGLHTLRLKNPTRILLTLRLPHTTRTYHFRLR